MLQHTKISGRVQGVLFQGDQMFHLTGSFLIANICPVSLTTLLETPFCPVSENFIGHTEYLAKIRYILIMEADDQEENLKIFACLPHSLAMF